MSLTHETHHSEASKASACHPMEPDPVYPELGPAEAAAEPAYSGGTSSLIENIFWRENSNKYRYLRKL